MSDDAAYAPKYVRIMETLRRRIKDGTYPVGEPIPSETMLGREFGASRPTVVRALNEMQLLGELQREHGRGTFVKAAASSGAPQNSRPGLAVLDRQETPASVRVLEVGRCPAPNAVAMLLGLAESAPVHLRRYVGLYDSIPSELVSLWAPLDVARSTGLDQEGPLTVPVRQLLARSKDRLTRVDERLQARRPTGDERQALDLAEGEPVLAVLGSVVDSTGRTVLVVEVALPGSLHVLEDSYGL